MKLLTKAIKTKLIANAAKAASGVDTSDTKPVLKLFNPTGAATWLISELDEDGIMYGLADLGMGSPELGYVSLAELESVKLPFGLGIERDRNFTPTKTLMEYAEEAWSNGSLNA